MKHTEFSWQNIRKEKIFAQKWEIEAPKAILAIVHGMGEHSTRYTDFANFFNEKGFSCYTFDHVGHGKSEGKRGHTDSFDELLDGIDHLITHASEKNANIPIYLFGHSMGGNLVLNYAMRRKHNLSGLLVSAPWIRLAFQPPAFKVKLAGIMNKIYPKFTENNALKGEKVTRTKHLADAYDADELVHQNISTRFFMGVTTAADWIMKNPEKLTVRTMLMHGTGDVLTSYAASKEFAQKAGENLTFVSFDDWFHELHNEPEHEYQWNLILEWIDKKV